MLRSVLVALFVLSFAVSALAAKETVVLYGERATTLGSTLDDPTDLWLSEEDLTRINGFVLKPEGICRDEICIPVLQDRDSELLVRRDGKPYLCATELARRLHQSWIADQDSSVWSFGEIPAARTAFYDEMMAPDFELPDREGKLVKLSDFRGKKVLIISWASW
jgi:hypothetical protein